MAYSEAKVIAGGLAHIPILIGVFWLIRSYFNKFGGSLGISGSVEYLFEHKCNFKFNPKP